MLGLVIVQDEARRIRRTGQTTAIVLPHTDKPETLHGTA